MSGPKVTWHRHAVAAILSTAFFLALLTTAADIGFARDEGFYYHAALQYQEWFDELFQSPGSALSRESVDRYWGYNREHPALMKTLFGFSWRLLHRDMSLLRPSTALRLPGMFMAAICIYLTILVGWRLHGPLVGVAAGLLLALQPRFFYHSHLACFDVPVTAMWLLTVYCVQRANTSKRWAVFAGIAFGICLCTKLNAFFLPPLLFAHHLLLWWWERRKGIQQRPALPLWIFTMAIIGPVIFFAHWPWIWFETVDRIGFYLGFHRGHAYYNMEYFGQTYFRPPLPISFPFVMTVVTLPVTTSLLIATGAFKRATVHLSRRWRERLGIVELAETTGGPAGTDLLLAFCALFPILLIAMPTVPIFGGTKHWLPAMPFLALLAGVGVKAVVDASRSYWPRAERLAAAAVIVALVVPAFVETVTSHPFGIAHYSLAAGGTRGAADIGFNRQFWGYTTGSITEWLNREVGRNGRVFFHDTALDSVRLFKDDGALRRDIRWAGTDSADIALVHHEQHMAHVEYEIWERFGHTAPTMVLTHEGVPIISVYTRRERGRILEP